MGAPPLTPPLARTSYFHTGEKFTSSPAPTDRRIPFFSSAPALGPRSEDCARQIIFIFEAVVIGRACALDTAIRAALSEREYYSVSDLAWAVRPPHSPARLDCAVIPPARAALACGLRLVRAKLRVREKREKQQLVVPGTKDRPDRSSVYRISEVVDFFGLNSVTECPRHL